MRVARNPGAARSCYGLGMADAPAAHPLAPAHPTTAAREQVIDYLSGAFADGTLELDEFERRVTLAHTSTSASELAALTADLAPGAPTVTASPTRQLVPAASVRPTGRAVAVFGSIERRGPWSVPRSTQIVSVFGNGEIDLREARLPAGRIDLRVVAVFGNVEIIVPPHLAIEAEGTAVFGGFEHLDRTPAELSPDAPTLRVTGVSVFGNVEVSTRLPGESARDAARRRRDERRGKRRD
jgi:hypothetical protein